MFFCLFRCLFAIAINHEVYLVLVGVKVYLLMFIILYINNNLEIVSQVPMGICKTAVFQHGIHKLPMGFISFKCFVASVTTEQKRRNPVVTVPIV